MTETGELFIWGVNSSNQLGLGDTENRTTPVQVDALAGKTVLDVALGNGFTFALVK